MGPRAELKGLQSLNAQIAKVETVNSQITGFFNVTKSVHIQTVNALIDVSLAMMAFLPVTHLISGANSCQQQGLQGPRGYIHPDCQRVSLRFHARIA